MVKKRTKASKKKHGGSASYARALPFNTTAPNGGNPAEAAMNNMIAGNTAQATMTKAYSGGAQLGFATVPSFGTDNTANDLSVGGNTTYMQMCLVIKRVVIKQNIIKNIEQNTIKNIIKLKNIKKNYQGKINKQQMIFYNNNICYYEI